jgi:hypothetical protein
MKLKVNRYEWVKTLIEGVEINIPELPFAYNDGRGCHILVKPEWTTWQEENGKGPEEIYELRILRVNSYLNTIDKGTLPMYPENIESLLTAMLKKDGYSLVQGVLDKIMRFPEDDHITVESFWSYYNQAFSDYEEETK